MPINDNTPSEKKPKRTKGILLDEKQWMFLKERYKLSSRELQVAILLCRGFSNQEMADALNIQAGTIKTHLRNLYRSFRVNNKVLLILAIIDDVIERFYVPIQLAVNQIPIQEIPSQTDAAAAVFEPEKRHG
jgi:DNA-binding NarL/FixJ family response regulator